MIFFPLFGTFPSNSSCALVQAAKPPGFDLCTAVNAFLQKRVGAVQSKKNNKNKSITILTSTLKRYCCDLDVFITKQHVDKDEEMAFMNQ